MRPNATPQKHLLTEDSIWTGFGIVEDDAVASMKLEAILKELGY
jgi:hypothetical protein